MSSGICRLIVGKSKRDAEAAFQRTKNLLQSFGFVINLMEPGNSDNQVSGIHYQLQGDQHLCTTVHCRPGWAILQPPPTMTIKSNTGWEAHCGSFRTRDRWLVQEDRLYINCMELLVTRYIGIAEQQTAGETR